jgi:hypothetical protein
MGKILEARYLNVDLVVEADFDLSPIIAMLKGKVLFLWDKTSPELSTFGVESNLTDSESPEEDIVELLQILEKLPDEQKKMLSASKKKVIDIGFECGTIDTAIDMEISVDSIHRMSKFGCLINIRLYPWVESPREGR